jgi:hypothetical protein
VLVTLRVEAPAPLVVELLDKLRPGEPWRAEEKGAPAVKPVGEKGAALWQMAFLVEPLQPGEHLLELPPLRYRSGAGDWSEVKWSPLKVKVTTAVKKADPEAARDIAPIEELPPLPEAWGWVPWAAGGAGAALVGAAVVLLRRRRVVRQPPPTAEQWALAELDRLAAREPAGAEAVERFHRDLSAVLRHFLERRHHLPAERRTTAEFLQVLRSAAALGEDLQSVLGETLARCDLAKFARVVPSPEECRSLVTQAQEFVRKAATPAPEVLAGEPGAEGQDSDADYRASGIRS